MTSPGPPGTPGFVGREESRTIPGSVVGVLTGTGPPTLALPVLTVTGVVTLGPVSRSLSSSTLPIVESPTPSPLSTPGPRPQTGSTPSLTSTVDTPPSTTREGRRGPVTLSVTVVLLHKGRLMVGRSDALPVSDVVTLTPTPETVGG